MITILERREWGWREKSDELFLSSTPPIHTTDYVVLFDVFLLPGIFLAYISKCSVEKYIHGQVLYKESCLFGSFFWLRVLLSLGKTRPGCLKNTEKS